MTDSYLSAYDIADRYGIRIFTVRQAMKTLNSPLVNEAYRITLRMVTLRDMRVSETDAQKIVEYLLSISAPVKYPTGRTAQD